MLDRLPDADFYVIVSHSDRRPDCEVWFWDLPATLPVIRLPLRSPEEEVRPDLQQVFNGAYDRAGYALSLRYEEEVQPPRGPADALWVRECLGNATDFERARGSTLPV
jgi:hypothetical protein